MADDRLTDRLINAYLKLRNLYTSTSSINTGPRNKKKKRCRADAIWSGSSTVAIHRAKADNFSCALLMVRIFISKSSDAEIFICQTQYEILYKYISNNRTNTQDSNYFQHSNSPKTFYVQLYNLPSMICIYLVSCHRILYLLMSDLQLILNKRVVNIFHRKVRMGLWDVSMYSVYSHRMGCNMKTATKVQ